MAAQLTKCLRSAIVLGVALLSLGPFARADHTKHRSAVRYVYEDARIYVPVSSSSISLGWFILDTGVSDALLDSSLRDRLQLPTLSSKSEQGAGTGQLQTSASHNTTLLVDKTILHLPSTRIAPLSKVLEPYIGRKIGGIIGGAFFRDHIVIIDLQHHRIELRDPQTFQYRGTGHAVKFRFVEGVPIADGTISLPDGRQLSLRLLIDLGAKANLLLSEPFVQQNRLLSDFSFSVVEPLGAGIGGETRYAFVRMPQVTVGGNSGPSITSFVAGLSVNGTLRGGYYDGLLGVEFLRHYRVTIDYARQQVVFEPVTRPVPERFDESGAFVTVDPENHQFSVRYVVPNSPATEAGLAPGDVLDTINGKLVGSCSLASIRSLLQGKRGANVSMVVRRAGKKKPIRIRLHNLL